MDEFRPDVVLASWAYPDGWAAVELAREAGLPVAVKVHGSDVLLLRRSSARYRRTVEALQRADCVIAVSRQLAGEVMALGIDPAKVSVVYNGIDRSLFFPADSDAARERLGVGSEEPLILSVGNLAAVKGPDILIEACDRLARRGVRFGCWLIGQGAMKPSLERMIRERGLGEKIKLLGSRPLVELPDWYRAAAMLVLASRSEGLPNVVLEAMACGTHVVASRVGGVSEIAGDGVILVMPGDPEALAAAIEQALSLSSGARFSFFTGEAASGKNNRAPNAKAMGHPMIAQNFTPPSWDQSAAALAGVLEGLLISRRKAIARAA
jgi:glycosyltransferase involved in cell wall biosynthesis